MKIVLVETTHPGNIGATARAMKNMGLNQLVLVKPKHYPSTEATSRSSGAWDILEAALVVDTLEEAIFDCNLVVGTSARRRSQHWQTLNPEKAIELAFEQGNLDKVAFVFGRESSGLTNEELDKCTHLLHIHANDEYSSLNLAMAVQIICYEYQLKRILGEGETQSRAETKQATSEQMERFFSHLEQTLFDLEFMHVDRKDKLLTRLRRFFFRAMPDEEELNILRGILSSAQSKKISRKK